VLSSNRSDALKDARQNCDRPEEHVVQLLDLTEPSTLRDAAEQVHDDVGPVDILVNNAGIGHGGPVAKTDVDDVRRAMEINFFGTIQLTKAVLPRIRARQAGQIAVVSSIAGKVALPKASAYAASKHAVQADTAGMLVAGWEEKLLVYMNRFVPRLFRSLSRREA